MHVFLVIQMLGDNNGWTDTTSIKLWPLPNMKRAAIQVGNAKGNSSLRLYLPPAVVDFLAAEIGLFHQPKHLLQTFSHKETCSKPIFSLTRNIRGLRRGLARVCGRFVGMGWPAVMRVKKNSYVSLLFYRQYARLQAIASRYGSALPYPQGIPFNLHNVVH